MSKAKHIRSLKSRIKQLDPGPEPYINSSEWFPWQYAKQTIQKLETELDTYQRR